MISPVTDCSCTFDSHVTQWWCQNQWYNTGVVSVKHVKSGSKSILANVYWEFNTYRKKLKTFFICDNVIFCIVCFLISNITAKNSIINNILKVILKEVIFSTKYSTRKNLNFLLIIFISNEVCAEDCCLPSWLLSSLYVMV